MLGWKWDARAPFWPQALHAAASVAADVKVKKHEPRRMVGKGKVFVAAAFDEARAAGYGGDLDEFKAGVWDGKIKGELSVARADLVEAMDPELVRRSEIQVAWSENRPRRGFDSWHVGTTVHFIRVPWL